MSSSIHFKFKSSLETETLFFDGPNISLADLKKQIIEKKHMAALMAIFDLQIVNTQNREEYKQNDMIPKNSMVIVSRIPISKTIKKEARKDLSTLEPLKIENTPLGPTSLLPTDLANLEASEDKKVEIMMNQATQDYSHINYQMKPRILSGPVPRSYICHQCGQMGHFIQNCPNPKIQDSDVAGMPRLKRSTGIPSSFTTPANDINTPGVLINASGKLVVPIIDALAYKEGKKEKPPFVKVNRPLIEPESKVPRELLCPICKDLLKYAVVVPCCGNSACDECIRNKIVESETFSCPLCQEKNVSPDRLIPNVFLRTAVNNFTNERGYTSATTTTSTKSVAQLSKIVEEVKPIITTVPMTSTVEVKNNIINIPPVSELNANTQFSLPPPSYQPILQNYPQNTQIISSATINVFIGTNVFDETHRVIHRMIRPQTVSIMDLQNLLMKTGGHRFSAGSQLVRMIVAHPKPQHPIQGGQSIPSIVTHQFPENHRSVEKELVGEAITTIGSKLKEINNIPKESQSNDSLDSHGKPRRQQSDIFEFAEDIMYKKKQRFRSTSPRSPSRHRSRSYSRNKDSPRNYASKSKIRRSESKFSSSRSRSNLKRSRSRSKLKISRSRSMSKRSRSHSLRRSNSLRRSQSKSLRRSLSKSLRRSRSKSLRLSRSKSLRDSRSNSLKHSRSKSLRSSRSKSIRRYRSTSLRRSRSKSLKHSRSKSLRRSRSKSFRRSRSKSLRRSSSKPLIHSRSKIRQSKYRSISREVYKIFKKRSHSRSLSAHKSQFNKRKQDLPKQYRSSSLTRCYRHSREKIRRTHSRTNSRFRSLTPLKRRSSRTPSNFLGHNKSLSRSTYSSRTPGCANYLRRRSISHKKRPRSRSVSLSRRQYGQDFVGMYATDIYNPAKIDLQYQYDETDPRWIEYLKLYKQWYDKYGEKLGYPSKPPGLEHIDYNKLHIVTSSQRDNERRMSSSKRKVLKHKEHHDYRHTTHDSKERKYSSKPKSKSKIFPEKIKVSHHDDLIKKKKNEYYEPVRNDRKEYDESIKKSKKKLDESIKNEKIVLDKSVRKDKKDFYETSKKNKKEFDEPINKDQQENERIRNDKKEIDELIKKNKKEIKELIRKDKYEKDEIHVQNKKDLNKHIIDDNYEVDEPNKKDNKELVEHIRKEKKLTNESNKKEKKDYDGKIRKSKQDSDQLMTKLKEFTEPIKKDKKKADESIRKNKDDDSSRKDKTKHIEPIEKKEKSDKEDKPSQNNRLYLDENVSKGSHNCKYNEKDIKENCIEKVKLLHKSNITSSDLSKDKCSKKNEENIQIKKNKSNQMLENDEMAIKELDDKDIKIEHQDFELHTTKSCTHEKSVKTDVADEDLKHNIQKRKKYRLRLCVDPTALRSWIVH